MKYNSIIIGFGKGGKTLAGALAKIGEKVALIEKSANMYGGTCINVGCIPSKSLVRSSMLSNISGGNFEDKALRYKEAINVKRKLTSALRQKNYDKLNNSENVDIIDATASFIDNHSIKIVDINGNESAVTGEKIFINTGAHAFMPDFKGIKDNPFVYTSESLMDLDVLPEKLVLIGAGYIGLEFASMYSSFGSKVTIIQDGDRFLPKEDEDIANEILKILQEKGVEFKLGYKIKEIEHNNSGALIKFENKDEVLEANAILVATGRRPNTAELMVQNAGVELTPRGAVKVDDNLKTTADNIWAMGDVTGGLQFTYTSLDDYRIVLSALKNSGDKKLSQRKNVPYSVFIDPAFSRVGLNETEALKQGYSVKIAKLQTAAIPKAQVLKNPKGMLKAVIDEKTQTILGCMFICEESYEMINLVKMAIDLKLPYTYLRDSIFTHPTMTESLNDLFNV